MVFIVKFVYVDVEFFWICGQFFEEIFGEMVELKLMQLIFIIGYLVDIFLLVCCSDDNLFFIDCFEFFIGGCEVVNGFLELNDVED